MWQHLHRGMRSEGQASLSFEPGCWLGAGDAEQACPQDAHRSGRGLHHSWWMQEPGAEGGGSVGGVRKGTVGNSTSGLLLEGACQVE